MNLFTGNERVGGRRVVDLRDYCAHEYYDIPKSQEPRIVVVTDLTGENIDDANRDSLCARIALNPTDIFLVGVSRPDVWREYMTDDSGRRVRCIVSTEVWKPGGPVRIIQHRWPPRNLWLYNATPVRTQAGAETIAPRLLSCQAAGIAIWLEPKERVIIEQRFDWVISNEGGREPFLVPTCPLWMWPSHRDVPDAIRAGGQE